MIIIKHWILLLIYSSLTTYIGYLSSNTWPHVGNRLSLLLLFVLPALLYQFFFICYFLTFKQSLRWKKRLRIFTIISGILLAGQLGRFSEKIALSRFESTYHVLVSSIHLGKTNPCALDVWESKALVNYNQTGNQIIDQSGKPVGTIWYNTSRFIIHFRGGSIDIDGSSIVYDSRTNLWSIFHNDDKKNEALYQAAISGLHYCRL